MSTHDKQILIRLPEKLHKSIKAAAEITDTSVSDLVRKAMQNEVTATFGPEPTVDEIKEEQNSFWQKFSGRRQKAKKKRLAAKNRNKMARASCQQNRGTGKGQKRNSGR